MFWSYFESGRRTVARCASCDAEVFWVKTRNGKSMPIDAQHEMRLVAVLGDDDLILAGTSDDAVVRMVPTYTSHFATCPSADQHRKR